MTHAQLDGMWLVWWYFPPSLRNVAVWMVASWGKQGDKCGSVVAIDFFLTLWHAATQRTWLVARQ